MALSPGILIPQFTEIFSTPAIHGSITGIRVVNAITTYLSTGQNAAFGTYVTWAFPFAQMIEVFSVPKIIPSLFAVDFTGAVVQGLAGLYTIFQLNAIQAAGPVMYPMVELAVNKYNINSIPFAIEMANAIHAQASSIIITVTDPKTLGLPYPGPFF